jgi:acyl dehydratase/NADP-dependent 3-hydroxy acid dehydrogenase YdfG
MPSSPLTAAAERTFQPADQLAFAALSGDSNPLHVDLLAARRTSFGQTIVHGVHLLLWGLDLAWKSAGPRTLTSIQATFRQPVRVGETVRCQVALEGTTLTGTMEVAGKAALRFSAAVQPESASWPLPPDGLPTAPCREISFAEAAGASGSLPLALDRSALARLLPHVARSLAPVQAAEILATTRLIGMECPGRHSTFVALDLQLKRDLRAMSGPQDLAYTIEQAEPRFSLLCLGVTGPTLRGTLKALYRPPPQVQASAAALAPLVGGEELAGERVLVVGGSRGLGEVAAKLAAVAGADVVLTYHRGAGDAQQVVRAAGGSCRAIAFDVTQPPADLSDRLGQGWQPTQLHYFATPLISIDNPRGFSAEKFARFCAYYVEGFQATLQAVRAIAPGLRSVLYPSTVYLEGDAPPGSAEYCAAKAAGEILCRHLAGLMEETHFSVPRLPRLRTDQTASVLDLPGQAPEGALLPVLRGLRMPPRP